MTMLINPYAFGAGATPPSFDPLNDISWHTAFWVEDPNWTDPGDGNAVSSWRNDGSGDWGDAAQATGTKQPLYRSSVAALNSQPAIDFDGTDDNLKSAVGTGQAGAMTVVAVVDLQSPDGNYRYIHDRATEPSDPAKNRFITGLTSSNTWRMYVDSAVEGGSPASGGQLLFIYFASGGTSTLDVDGTQDLSGNPGTVSTNGFTLGADYGGGVPTGMRLAFFALKIGALTATEESDLLSWAQSHYGTP